MTAKGQPGFRRFSTDVALDIVQAMDHPGLFKQWFDGPSWGGWRAVLKSAFCLPMSEAEIAFFKSDPSSRRMITSGSQLRSTNSFGSSQQSPLGALPLCRSWDQSAAGSVALT